MPTLRTMNNPRLSAANSKLVAVLPLVEHIINSHGSSTDFHSSIRHLWTLQIITRMCTTHFCARFKDFLRPCGAHTRRIPSYALCVLGFGNSISVMMLWARRRNSMLLSKMILYLARPGAQHTMDAYYLCRRCLLLLD